MIDRLIYAFEFGTSSRSTRWWRVVLGAPILGVGVMVILCGLNCTEAFGGTVAGFGLVVLGSVLAATGPIVTITGLSGSAARRLMAFGQLRLAGSVTGVSLAFGLLALALGIAGPVAIAYRPEALTGDEFAALAILVGLATVVCAGISVMALSGSIPSGGHRLATTFARSRRAAAAVVLDGIALIVAATGLLAMTPGIAWGAAAAGLTAVIALLTWLASYRGALSKRARSLETALSRAVSSIPPLTDGDLGARARYVAALRELEGALGVDVSRGAGAWLWPGAESGVAAFARLTRFAALGHTAPTPPIDVAGLRVLTREFFALDSETRAIATAAFLLMLDGELRPAPWWHRRPRTVAAASRQYIAAATSLVRNG